MIRRPPRSTLSSSSAASDVYKRQVGTGSTNSQASPLGITGSSVPPFLDYYELQSHRVQISGDFTNNGTVRFSNLTKPVYKVLSSTEFTTVYFHILSDTSLTCKCN